MSSILLLLSIDQSRINYVLTCQGDRRECLLKWLTSSNIALCKPEQYDNPDTLKPLNMYCVENEKVTDSYKIFQVLVTSDWDDNENSPPQFVNDVGWIAWVDIPKNPIIPVQFVNISTPLI